MSDHEPTITDSVDPDQPGEALDAAKLPDEFPQRPVASFDHGTTEREMAEGESLDQRLGRERPDVGEGGQGPLASTTATPLLDDADPDGLDTEKDLVADTAITEPHIDDSGQPTTPTNAETAAMRVEDADDVPGAVDHRAVRPDA